MTHTALLCWLCAPDYHGYITKDKLAGYWTALRNGTYADHGVQIWILRDDGLELAVFKRPYDFFLRLYWCRRVCLDPWRSCR